MKPVREQNIRGCKNFCKRSLCRNLQRAGSDDDRIAESHCPKELLTACWLITKSPEDLIGENGLLKQLTKLLVEKAWKRRWPITSYGKHEPVANSSGKPVTAKSRKTLKGEFGELPIEIPCDRHGTFEPQLIPQAPDPLDRLRRQDPVALRPRG